MQPSPTVAVSRRLRAATPPPFPPILHTFTGAVVDLCRNDDRDLTARQMGVLLTVALQPGPHTVRGLAARLNVNKPAITRALDRLGDLCLVQRQFDPADRRSVLVTAQAEGHRVVRGIGDSLRGHAAAGGEA